MTAQHTPGPWQMGRTIRGYVDIDAPHSPSEWQAFARVVVETQGSNGYSRDEEGVANAHLIAAAPDLLAVAERLLDRGYVSKHIPEEHDDHMALVTAIAKATGAA